MEVRKMIYRIGKILPKSWTDSRRLFALFVKPQQLKMLVLDLDGTTLNDQKEMIPENITAIKNLRRKNPKIIVCVATGRTFHESVRFAQKIEADFLLTNNGSAFYQRVGTKYELGKAFTLSEQQYQTIYNQIRKYESENSDLAWRIGLADTRYNIITDNQIGVLKKIHKAFSLTEEKVVKPVLIKDFAEIRKQGLSQSLLNIYLDFGQTALGKKQYQEFEEFLQREKVDYFQWSDSQYEIVPKGVNKGSTLAVIIAEQRKKGNYIKEHEVMVLGNAENDLPMFEKGFRSLCPANSWEGIEKAKNVRRLKVTNNEPFVQAALDEYYRKPSMVKRLLEEIKERHEAIRRPAVLKREEMEKEHY